MAGLVYGRPHFRAYFGNNVYNSSLVCDYDMCLQIPGGWLADRFGGKWLYGGSVLLSSVLSLLTPTAARIHLGVLVLLRVVSGLGQGILLPAAYALITRWSSPKYHTLVVSSVLSGVDIGVVVGIILPGVLSDFGFAGGWPSVFYVFGMVGCLWSVAWFSLCYDSPSTHPRLSSEEREYWSSVLGIENWYRSPTPWREMLTSVPVWALAVFFFANEWCYYTLASCIPLFMHDVLGFDMTKNGVLSAVPFLAMLLAIPYGFFADWLRSPGRLSTNVVRKAFCAAGSILVSCLFTLVGYTGCNRALTVVIMFTVMACLIISGSVVAVNQLDLAPPHSGKLMGMTYCVASLGSIFAPHAVGFLTSHRSSRSEWNHVFFLAAAIYAVGAVVFLVFGSGDRQSWSGTEEITLSVSRLQQTASSQQTVADDVDVQQTTP